MSETSSGLLKEWKVPRRKTKTYFRLSASALNLSAPATAIVASVIDEEDGTLKVHDAGAASGSAPTEVYVLLEWLKKRDPVLFEERVPAVVFQPPRDRKSVV